MSMTLTFSVPSYQQLVQLSQEHEERIEEIKNEVAQQINNLDTPEPLFDQLIK